MKDSKPQKPSERRWSLAPLALLAPIVDVLQHGADKGYDPRSWEHCHPVVGISKYQDAMMRHIEKWQINETDPESGINHLAAVAFNALCVLWHQRELHSVETTQGPEYPQWGADAPEDALNVSQDYFREMRKL